MPPCTQVHAVRYEEKHVYDSLREDFDGSGDIRPMTFWVSHRAQNLWDDRFSTPLRLRIRGNACSCPGAVSVRPVRRCELVWRHGLS